jgi:hypothetical protein
MAQTPKPTKNVPTPPKVLQVFRRIPWLSVIGVILLFIAWAIDSFLTAERAAALHEMDLAQSRVSTNEILKNQWQTVFLQERLRPEPDNLVIASSGLAYIQFASNTMVAAAGAVGSSDLSIAEQAKRRRLLYETARERFSKGDHAGIESLALTLEKLEVSAAPDLTEAFAVRYSMLKGEEARFNSWFLSLYVLGSAAVGGAYLWSFRDGGTQGAA